MRKILFLLLPLALWPVPARAEILVVTPGVTVRVGRAGVLVAPRGLPVPIVVPFPGATPTPIPVPTVPAPVPPARVAPAVLPAPEPLPGDPPPVPTEPVPRAVIPLPGSTPPVPPSPGPSATTASVSLKPVPTVSQFAATFQPRGGAQSIVVEHPFTHTPVRFTVRLPASAPRLIRVSRRMLELDYGVQLVQVRFFPDGSVQVRN